MLKKVKSYKNNNMNSAKVNFIYLIKENFVQQLRIHQILAEFQIVDDDYSRALSISKDDNFGLYLKIKPNSCFVNNCFNDGLVVWQANMDIQPISNKYKSVIYMWTYFSKCEDQCSAVMKEAALEAYESILHHYQTMKTISGTYSIKN